MSLLFTFAFLGASAQEEKKLVVDANAEVRTTGAFNGIEVSDAIDLYLSQGNEEAVAISGIDDEIKGRIRTEVRGGMLRIYFDGKGMNWKKWNNNRMKAYVTYKTLNRLEASGACNVRTTDVIRQPELAMEFSGASDFTGDVAVTKLRITGSGACNMKITGSASNASIEASGACHLKAYDLATDMCRIDASGGSDVRITVNKELNANASGGSNIYYRGSGLIRDISSSGGATVKRKDN